MQNQSNENQQGTPCQNKTAIAQLALTFGSKAEMLELFDDLINRIIWAYSGTAQELHNLRGDCDFLHQLKKALREDI